MYTATRRTVSLLSLKHKLQLLDLRDLDLDLESCHAVLHCRVSLIDLYLHTKFRWNRKTFTDGHWDWLCCNGAKISWTSNILISRMFSPPHIQSRGSTFYSPVKLR